jgi:hypothetical protein
VINLLFFISCTLYSKQKIEYTRIGIVDRTENGICIIEIDDSKFWDYSPTMIHVYSKNCKDGDIIAYGRKK